MVKKKDLVIAVLIIFCLTATLFLVKSTRSQTLGQYDPWLDINDDGKISMDEVVAALDAFGATGDPINKTALLLELQSKVASIEEAQRQAKWIRFYEPNETVNDQTIWRDAATFVWTPNNSTNNAILLTSCYLQYRGEDYHGIANTFEYGFFVEGRELWTERVETYDNYTWSPAITQELACSSPSQYVFPNRENYTITLRFMSDRTGLEVHVKSINILLEVVDGMPSS